MIQHMAHSGQISYTSDNAVEMFTSGREFFDRIFENIRNDALGRELVALLVEKARQGVDVRLMIPSLADHAFARSASYSYAQQALEAGVNVFRYKGFIHAKTMVPEAIKKRRIKPAFFALSPLQYLQRRYNRHPTMSRHIPEYLTSRRGNISLSVRKPSLLTKTPMPSVWYTTAPSIWMSVVS